MSLEVKHLRVYRDGVVRINDVSFMVPAHTTLGIIGPSGCGKTTLIKAVLGLLPIQGMVFINQHLIQHDDRAMVPLRLRRFGYVPQDLALWPHTTAEKTLALALDFSRNTIDSAQDLMSWTGLSNHAHKRPQELSGGEQKRLALARALAARPQLLVLDEPFSGLDMVAKRSLINTIITLKAQQHFILIVISHDLAEINALAHQVMVLHEGHCFWQGPREQLAPHSFPTNWNPLVCL